MALVPKILVVSNLQSTSPLWAFSLTHQRWEITLESHPEKAAQRWADTIPDLIICDLNPAAVSIDVVTQLRDETRLPILLFTSNRSDQFVLEAYAAGADECILKPIHPLIIEAKIKAWLRRSSNAPAEVLETLTVDDLRLVPSDRAVILDDQEPIHLSNLEMRLLYYLMEGAGRTLGTGELCEYVWSHQSLGDAVMLKNLVYRVRRKIEVDPGHPQYLHTVPGVGYRFIAK